jgi:hypothetical protein
MGLTMILFVKIQLGTLQQSRVKHLNTHLDAITGHIVDLDTVFVL